MPVKQDELILPAQAQGEDEGIGRVVREAKAIVDQEETVRAPAIVVGELLSSDEGLSCQELEDVIFLWLKVEVAAIQGLDGMF